MKYEKLNKNALKCIYVSSGIWDIIGIAAVLVVWRCFLAENQIVKIAAYLLLALLLFELLVNPVIRYNRYRYAIDDECIDIVEGLFFIKRNIVPIERLHKIAIHRGPIDRIFGLGKVIVTTAGGDVIIRYVDIEKAEHISENLKQRINQAAIASRGEQNGK